MDCIKGYNIGEKQHCNIRNNQEPFDKFVFILIMEQLSTYKIIFIGSTLKFICKKGNINN